MTKINQETMVWVWKLNTTHILTDIFFVPQKLTSVSKKLGQGKVVYALLLNFFPVILKQTLS